MSWTWRYEDSSGAPVEPAADAPTVGDFPNQADAETWIGENWRELLAAGVAQVTLFEGDRKVYGPMGLDSPV
jgi:hypothetical protein